MGVPQWGDWLTRLGDESAFLQSGLYVLKGGPVCVVNFDESAWVSPQGLIEVIFQLKSGNSGKLFRQISQQIHIREKVCDKTPKEKKQRPGNEGHQLLFTISFHSLFSWQNALTPWRV